MSVPTAITYVEHEPGTRLSNGYPSGLGGRTTYRVAITTNGIDRYPLPKTFTEPAPAARYADRQEQKERDAA